MTKYRDQMLSIISNEINRVYHLFLRNNPDFLARGGKVSLLGHSLGVCISPNNWTAASGFLRGMDKKLILRTPSQH